MLRISLIMSLLIGCSGGEIHEKRDRYQNIFGFGLQGNKPGTGSFLGRLVSPDGDPAAWSQVYLQSNEAVESDNKSSLRPQIQQSNGKGGFYFRGLRPGAYTLIVTAPNGNGLKKVYEVQKDHTLEEPAIDLAPLVRVSGKVSLEAEPRLAGSLVYVPGTMFSSFTDGKGFYHLDLPRGEYILRAERDTFEPKETDKVELTTDETLDFELNVVPWPTAKVFVETEDGFVIRGLKANLTIEPKTGVRWMRYWVSTKFSTTYSAWEPVQTNLQMTFEEPGPAGVRFEFRDGYGNESEVPVEVEFHNTDLDKTWKLFHSVIDDAVVIKSGEKVAFLERPTNGGSSGPDVAPMPANGDANEAEQSASSSTDTGTINISEDDDDSDDDTVSEVITNEDISMNKSSINDIDFISGSHTKLNKSLIIEAGARVIGNVWVKGDIEIRGTSQNPVTWDRAGIDADGDRVVINHLQTKSARIISRADLTQIENSIFISSRISSHLVTKEEERRVKLKLKNNYFKRWTAIEYACVSYPLIHANHVFTIELTQNLIEDGNIEMNCINRSEPVSNTRLDVNLIVNRNNFYTLDPTPFYEYFFSYYEYIDSTSTNYFPTVEQTNFQFGENHFEYLDMIYQGAARGPVPAHLGQAVDFIEDAGPH